MPQVLGTVVFVDLAGYSSKPEPDQQRLAQSLFDKLSSEIRTVYGTEMKREEADPPFVVLTTGDGAAVAVLRAAPDDRKTELTALRLAARLMLWAKDEGVGLRCGINGGRLDRTRDPYGQSNVCGAAINEAARLMDAANPDQILVSFEHFAQQLSDEDRTTVPGLEFTIHPEGHEILAKHSLLLQSRVVTGSLDVDGEPKPFGDAKPPKEKWHLQIEPPILDLDDRGRLVKKVPPVKLLTKHERIAFVGASNNTLLPHMEEAHADRKQVGKGNWERIEVFFLSNERLEWMAYPSRTGEQIIAGKDAALAALPNFLDRTADSWRMYEHDRPFCFASYWDWDNSGGRIHVSPYVWGQDVKSCPGHDHVWKSRNRTQPYATYVQGLESLRELATGIAGNY